MTPQEHLEQIKRDWKWRSDGSKDRWHLGPLQGPFEGDCEEFALTLLLRIAGGEQVAFAMLADGSARIERVLSERGNGHAVLWLKDWGYVDSIHPFWRENRLFEHKQTFSARDIERKLAGKADKGGDKKLLVLAALIGAVAVFLLFGA